MAKDITIVTEGKFEANVLTLLLNDKSFELSYEILAASGYSSALSKARSLLLVRDTTVLLLLDTDSWDKAKISEREDFVSTYMRANNFKTFWAVPEFEAVFLDNIKFMEALLEKSIDSQLLEVAKSSPKRNLELLSDKKPSDYLQLLNDHPNIRAEFFETGLIKELVDYMAQESKLKKAV